MSDTHDQRDPGDAGHSDAGEAEGHEDHGRSRRGRMGDGIRQGIGVLSAFKEALEETIQEARDRGDLSTDRAKEVMREALDRAQNAAEDAREKFDFAAQGDLEQTRSELDGLKAGLQALQERVRALEEEVLGSGSAEQGKEGGG